MAEPLISLENTTLRLGGRTLWKDLDLAVQPGEFIAILGPNGAGKTSLLRGLLGLHEFAKGEVAVQGKPPRRGNSDIGYIPQQKTFDRDLPIRGRDLVKLGLNGHRFGFVRSSKQGLRRVNEVIREVGASRYADKPLGLLSGGEQQRLRIAQSLLGKPRLLFCDEPLSSLDLQSQRSVSELIDAYRKQNNAAVLFVTHDINPVLDMVDRVLYLVNGKWAIGTPEEVLTTELLSRLYETPVDVLKVRGRIVVVNASDAPELNGHHHVPSSHGSGGMA
jgi:zinc/manganese transport system ATP-binding protein